MCPTPATHLTQSTSPPPGKTEQSYSQQSLGGWGRGAMDRCKMNTVEDRDGWKMVKKDTDAKEEDKDTHIKKLPFCHTLTNTVLQFTPKSIRLTSGLKCRFRRTLYLVSIFTSYCNWASVETCVGDGIDVCRRWGSTIDSWEEKCKRKKRKILGSNVKMRRWIVWRSQWWSKGERRESEIEKRGVRECERERRFEREREGERGVEKWEGEPPACSATKRPERGLERFRGSNWGKGTNTHEDRDAERCARQIEVGKRENEKKHSKWGNNFPTNSPTQFCSSLHCPFAWQVAWKVACIVPSTRYPLSQITVTELPIKRVLVTCTMFVDDRVPQSIPGEEDLKNKKSPKQWNEEWRTDRASFFKTWSHGKACI